MLIEFNLQNYRSYQTEQRFSLVANSDKALFPSHTFTPELCNGVKSMPLLHTAAIYGANASGKSNLLKAMLAMQSIIRSSTQLGHQSLTPFMFDSANREAPTLFEVVIYAEQVRYQYGFRLTADRIYDEWLFAYPKGRLQRWYERSFDPQSNQEQYRFGDKLTGEKEVWRKVTRHDALFLTTAVQLNSQQLLPVFNWFNDTLRIASVSGWSPGFTVECLQNQSKLPQILKFLQSADIAIDDLRLEEEHILPEEVEKKVPPALRQLFASQIKQGKSYRVWMCHHTNENETVELNLADESDGTQKLFSFAGPWLDALQQGKVIFMDELHSNLHPFLVKYLLDFYHNSQTNPNGAQLIFTTHETSNLDQETFRRDQIWFCERNRNQSTSLYPLTDFSPRKEENLQRAYLTGRYGALPIVQSLLDGEHG
ncbi:ATP-binding protein [Ectothiorhodospiraceae bacterium BW-2]|nr:ATP-binding protein [Ectothiorhodospiraceae bacterium BW-2]